jgi:tetratricopeptide (TPR) repeat protein
MAFGCREVRLLGRDLARLGAPGRRRRWHAAGDHYSRGAADQRAIEGCIGESEEIEDARREGGAHVLMANVLIRKGDFDAARASAQRALELATERHDGVTEYMARRELGLVGIKANDIPSARAEYGNALAVAQRLKNPMLKPRHATSSTHSLASARCEQDLRLAERSSRDQADAETAATSDRQRTRKPLFYRHSRSADTTHRAPDRLCKQEVTGSMPVGSISGNACKRRQLEPSE